MGRQDATCTSLMEEELPPMMIRDETGTSPPDSPVVSDNSHVFWRSETSLSESAEDDSFSSEERRSVFVIPPNSYKAQSLRHRNNLLLEFPVSDQKSYTVVEEDKKKTDVYVEVDLEKYMAAREMTPLQERINALTMIPAALMIIVVVLSGNWMSKTLVEEAMQDVDRMSLQETVAAFDANAICIDWSNTSGFGWLFEKMHALPPLPLMATALGQLLHTPFSFLYHWKYAHALPPTERTNHWSRRMDQSMLHVASAMNSFGTCGFLDFFFVNAIFAADSIYRQFESQVQPNRNQNRLGVAIVAWTIPILKRGDLDMLCQVLGLLAIGIFLFVRYPIGGWSHAAFHVVLTPLMPLLMEIGTSIPASQEHMKAAAQCFALAEHRGTWS